MQLDKNLIEEAITMTNDILNMTDEVAVVPRWAYSGRVMSGVTCFGVVVDQMTSFLAFLTVLTDMFGDGIEEMIEFTMHMRSDQLGKGTIYYFPGVEVTE